MEIHAGQLYYLARMPLVRGVRMVALTYLEPSLAILHLSGKYGKLLFSSHFSR